MISADSPDVWARQHEFRFDATIGVPPDAFSETGQDWGLPPWRAGVMASSGFTWMRSRARRYADLYDGFRIDHLVGLYRAYVRPIDKAREAFFEPAAEPEQIELGETLIGILSGNADVIAEDLGSIPAFVRESMARLDVPGLKVLRWERHWDRDGQPPIDPADFPERSVATTGTHDIEPLAATPDGETEEQRSAILRSLASAGSYLTLIPLQDVFGWTERINTPAVVNDVNWTWRVKWSVDRWLNPEEPMERADQLKAWTREAGR
jgi:4-alpha-glucanotransferase